MIHNEDAYYTGYYRNVRALGAVPALVFDTICGLIRETGIGEIANSTLCDLLGITPQGLIKVVRKLIETGYIDKSKGDGRGNKTVYMLTEKGKQSCPFIEKKGSTTFNKRVNDVSLKGKQRLTINKELKEEINKESSGVLREAQSPTPFTPTTQILENMEDFKLFWDLYPGDPEWSHEKESCERAWFAMQQSWRDNLVQQLQRGKRWRPLDKQHHERNNPLWYIQNYNGETVPVELPFLRQGSRRFSAWLEESQRNGRKIILMRYDTGDPNNTLAYCFSSDRTIMEAAGATYIRDLN